MNRSQSTKIFSQFMNGKVINSHKVDPNDDASIPNPFFTEVMSNLDAYTEHYRNCGFELVCELKDCFFIRPLNDEKTALELASKIQGLLIVIGRNITQTREIDILFDSKAGLSKDFVDKINNDNQMKTILEAVRIKGDLWEECKLLLVNRQLATVNRSGNLVLLAGAKSMYEAMIAGGSDAVFN